MTAPRRPPYWLCSPRTPTCRNRHPYISFRENRSSSIIEYRGGDSWLLLTCGRCGSHAFGVQSAAHDILHMYDVTAEQLEDLRSRDRATPAWVILEFLGYMEARDADAERAIAAGGKAQQITSQDGPAVGGVRD